MDKIKTENEQLGGKMQSVLQNIPTSLSLHCRFHCRSPPPSECKLRCVHGVVSKLFRDGSTRNSSRQLCYNTLANTMDPKEGKTKRKLVIGQVTEINKY